MARRGEITITPGFVLPATGPLTRSDLQRLLTDLVARINLGGVGNEEIADVSFSKLISGILTGTVAMQLSGATVILRSANYVAAAGATPTVGWALKGDGTIDSALKVAADGTVTIGIGTTKLVATPAGDFLWGTAGAVIGITKDGTMYGGGINFATAVWKLAANGDFTLLNTATSEHAIDPGAVGMVILPVVMTPDGGAFDGSINVSLNCLTQGAPIHYRIVAEDGVTINADPTFVSATGAFTGGDVGKSIVGTNIPADTVINSVTNSTTVEMSANASAGGSGLAWHLVPTGHDAHFVAGAITLTGSRRISAAAYKLGHWGPTIYKDFTNSAATVTNPKFGKLPGTYPTTSGQLLMPIAGLTAGASLRYTIDGTTTPTDLVGTLVSPSGSYATATITLPTGTTTIKMISFKSAMANSSVISGTYVVTLGGNPPDGTGGGGGPGGRNEP